MMIRIMLYLSFLGLVSRDVEGLVVLVSFGIARVRKAQRRAVRQVELLRHRERERERERYKERERERERERDKKRV